MNGQKISKTRGKRHRIARDSDSSIESSWKRPSGRFHREVKKDSILDCGWGRLLFGHTFESLESILDVMLNEKENHRDIAFYLPDPHVLLSKAPQKLFLDPSHTYRIRFERYQMAKESNRNIHIRRAESAKDLQDLNKIFTKRKMMKIPTSTRKLDLQSRDKCFVVAEDHKTNEIVGAVMGADHVYCFNDPEKGSSLWSLAVDPDCKRPGVGEALVRYLIEHYMARGRNYLDLSVMHNNLQAIALYEKLGFERIPVFCIKNKNAYNEPLYMSPEPSSGLNPYSEIIIIEARKRGVDVKITDAKKGRFTLSFGGRNIRCHESLTELTDAITYIDCSQKNRTYEILRKAKLKVPDSQIYESKKQAEAFLKKHSRVVVKPTDSEQGRGISVDIRRAKELQTAIDLAKEVSSIVQIEQYVEGSELRAVVINYELVAASIRRPPILIGNGKDSVQRLIQKFNRRRMAATGGESKIPLDAETDRCIKLAGASMKKVLKAGEEILVRKTANLHTGGSLHDVTEALHPHLRDVCEKAASALRIPVVGLDLIVSSHKNKKYVIIEANERPGLANHEPQPTAERFIDLLFPNTRAEIHERVSQ